MDHGVWNKFIETYFDSLCTSESLLKLYKFEFSFSFYSFVVYFYAGPNASILELADSIHAAQMQEDSDDWLFEPSASRTSGYYDDDKVQLKMLL